MALISKCLQDRLRFPVGGRSAGRVRKDARQASRLNGTKLNQQMNQLVRQHGLPLGWAQAMDYLVQYDRISPRQGNAVPAIIADHLIPAGGRVTLFGGTPASSTHQTARELILAGFADPKITATIYQDDLLEPNRYKHVGNEHFWFHGSEITDVLNNEDIDIEQAIELSGEMLHARHRIDRGHQAFCEWREQMNAMGYVYASCHFPSQKIRWNESVLYVSSTPITLSGTSDAVSAATLGARTLCINNLAPSWHSLMSPETWGLENNEGQEILLKELCARTDLVVHREKILATAMGSVIGHSYALVDPELSEALANDEIELDDWRQEVTASRVGVEQDIINQIESGALPEKIGEQALARVQETTVFDDYIYPTPNVA